LGRLWFLDYWSSEIKVLYPKLPLVKAHTILGKERCTGEVHSFVKENDSISQKMNYNGTSSNLSWSFKDTEGGLKSHGNQKVTWAFFEILYTALNGGVEEVIENVWKELSKFR
jgi:hypothetical protein